MVLRGGSVRQGYRMDPREEKNKNSSRIGDWDLLSAEFCLISRFRKLDRERDILDYAHFVNMRPIQLEPCQSCSDLMGNVLLHRRGCGPLRLLTRSVLLYQTPPNRASTQSPEHRDSQHTQSIQ